MPLKPTPFQKKMLAAQRYGRKRNLPKASVSKPVKAYVKKTITDTKESNWVDQRLGTGVTLRASYDVPYILDLTDVPQGDSISQREGDRIEPSSINLTMKLNHVSAVYQTRLMVIQWRPDTAVDALTLTKLLNAINADTVACQFNPIKSERSKFTVLYDRLINDAVGGQLQHFPKINIRKFANKYVNYNLGATSGKSKIYFIAFSNVLNSDGSRPSFFLNSRLTFKE